MIKSFADKVTEQFYITGKSKKFPADIHKSALRKLSYLNGAIDVNDLKIPPGNRLEALKGNYEGRYSIRINDQYRIIFAYEAHDAYDVLIIDYH
ncbi:MAG: type II toxin-antitoxin system RelE/ParE family toxin [Sulfuricurvum sp.]|nr:type II toxin-antitoxin system RelE/ParE family toxin [Sulfuricurvum sp.]MDP3465571.1 type II toxin-antitoxin system RelE/ParE family toxin [Sulfuricurvum sp.]